MWSGWAISRLTVLLLGIMLIVIAGIDLFLLQHLMEVANMVSISDASMALRHESSVALYLLPLMFAGVGVNMISHVLIEHLKGAERRFDKDHK